MLKRTKQVIKDFADLPSLMREAREFVKDHDSKPLAFPSRLKHG